MIQDDLTKKERGFSDVLGVTLSPGDVAICTEKGHKTAGYDLSFLPQKDGYHDESVDFILLRHALEHSPYPIFSLMEYNRILKQGSRIYIEVPAPDNDRKHEFNLNHYSIFGSTQLVALLQRTGFQIEQFNNLEFDLQQQNPEDPEGDPIAMREHYYCIVAKKAQGLDIK